MVSESFDDGYVRSERLLAEDGYSESLSNLVEATDETMAKYQVDEAPRAVASIAQRVSIKEKIELSISYVSFGVWRFTPFLMCFIIVSGRKVRSC